MNSLGILMEAGSWRNSNFQPQIPDTSLQKEVSAQRRESASDCCCLFGLGKQDFVHPSGQAELNLMKTICEADLQC